MTLPQLIKVVPRKIACFFVGHKHVPIGLFDEPFDVHVCSRCGDVE